MFGVSLNPREMGFNSLEELFKSVSHLVEVVIEPSSDDPGTIKTIVRLVKEQLQSANTSTQTKTSINTTPVTIKQSQPQIPRQQQQSQQQTSSGGSLTSPTSSDSSQSPSISSSQKPNNVQVDENNNQLQKSLPQPAKPLTAKQQVVYDIVRLIVNAGEKGVSLMSIGQEYKAMYNRVLDFEKFGYTSASTFIVENLPKSFQATKAKAFGDYIFITVPGKSAEEMMMLNEETKTTTTATSSTNELSVEKKVSVREKLKELREHCGNVLKEHLDQRLNVSEFWREFEAIKGWRPAPKDYDCSNYDELVGKLYQINAFMIELDQRHRLLVYMPSKQTLRSPCPLAPPTQRVQKNENQAKELSPEEVISHFLRYFLR